MKQGMYHMVKRILDITGALAGLFITALLFIPIAAAIKLNSTGPVIFRQTRVTRNGRHFLFYKFRTMVVDATLKQSQLDRLNEATGPIFKIRDDPRITTVGKWLRKYSLDELPQFWNVLSGDMSLVGPRPPLVHEVIEAHHGKIIVDSEVGKGTPVVITLACGAEEDPGMRRQRAVAQVWVMRACTHEPETSASVPVATDEILQLDDALRISSDGTAEGNVERDGLWR